MAEISNVTEDVKEAVANAADGGFISCPKARHLAKELKVSPKVVGKALDEMNIKIKDCELGCF